MKKNLFWWQFSGFSLVALLGTIFHFLYGWTNGNRIIASFCAINESVWEHTKILFFPLFLFKIVQSKYFKGEYPNFWQIKLLGIVVGILLVPVLYYTTIGAFGKSPDWLNITFFFVADGTAFAIEYFCFKYSSKKSANSWLPFAILLVIAILFVYFTYVPPKLPLFMDPISGRYGI
ncbi:MAG: hypothetical protein IKV38_00615 [Clostridia bacterium]|nr:hypothetical protein [Clostridia bacterium]